MAGLAGQVIRWGPLRTLGFVAGGLVLAGLLVLGTLYYQRGQELAEQGAAREAALGAARQVALDLVNLNTGTVDQAVDRLANSATEAFKPELTKQAEAIRQTVAQAKVSAQGTVSEAALSQSDTGRAVALAAVQATVSNAESPAGQPRQYRFRISLERIGDRWLVSNLEFVP
jgi:Mce-associated membrane protein